ncbi:MAG: prephenate dehydrogenase/arogenate dehydrogenase family protein [Bacillota bacterium]
MAKIKEVAVVGVGLLGSSLGLALKRFTAVEKIVGYDLNREHLKEAVEIGAIDSQISKLESTTQLNTVDLVIIATPVGVIPDVVKQIKPKLAPGTIITDVGSTKEWVIDEVKQLVGSKLTYIPAHPMTGSEVSGPEGADAYLFENAVYVLTPLTKTPDDKLTAVADLLEEIKANLLLMSPAEHDQIVAAVSHLPHIMACALVGAVGKAADSDERIFSLAAGGFRDTTRIAAGDPTMWSDICLSNTKFILEMIDTLKQELEEFEELLTTTDYDQLFTKFESMQSLRQRIPKKKRGLISPTYELVATISDRPNAIGEITTLLGAAGINIIDIEILQVRENGGTLRLAFGSAEELNNAEDLLTTAGYKYEIK